MAEQPDADNKAASADVDLLESPRAIDELCDEIIRALGYEKFGEPPPRFGKYEVRGILGEGGYGAVFQAWDAGLEREVAIKLCVCDPEMDAAIMLAEARALAKLSHPNIVTVFDFDVDEGRLFLVMEQVDGGTLHDYAIASQPETWQELIKVFADIARGMAYAHDKGVVHGDLKPENVLLPHDDLRPRVADFGLARMVGKQTLLPKAIGTRPYAAPEVLAGQVRDELSDQWSFFVTLCHCIDGKLPIVDTDVRVLPSSNEKMFGAIEGWAGPSTLHMPVPEELAEVLRVGLSFEPRERFGDMHAVAHALDGVFASGLVAGAVLEDPTVAEHVVVEPSSEEAPSEPSPRRGWKTGGLMALLLVMGVGLLGEVYVLGQRDGSRAEVARRELSPPGRRAEGQSPLGRAEGQGPLDSAEGQSPLDSVEGPSALDSAEQSSPLDDAEQSSPLDSSERSSPPYSAEPPNSLNSSEPPSSLGGSERLSPMDGAEPPTSDQRPPCVADGVPIEPDASMRATCRMLRTDGHQAALDLWNELSSSRELHARSSHDWLKIACDTTVLAQTFLHEADTAAPLRASKLRKRAAELVGAANTYLSRATGDETAKAVSKLRAIAARIIPPDVN